MAVGRATALPICTGLRLAGEELCENTWLSLSNNLVPALGFPLKVV
jgi:hypothetical protein